MASKDAEMDGVESGEDIQQDSGAKSRPRRVPKKPKVEDSDKPAAAKKRGAKKKEEEEETGKKTEGGMIPPPPPPPAAGGTAPDSEDEEMEETELPHEERPGDFLVKSIISELLIEFKTSSQEQGEEEETIYLQQEIGKRLRQDLDLHVVAIEKKKVEMSALMLHGITQMEITHGGAGVKSSTALFKLGDLLCKKLEHDQSESKEAEE